MGFLLVPPIHISSYFFCSKKTVLSCKEEGEDKIDELRRQREHLCEQEALEKVQKQKIQQSVGEVEEQWRSLQQTAAEVLKEAQTQADAQKQFDALKSQIEKVQLWIKDQKEKLLSASSHMQFEERMQMVQVGSHLRLMPLWVLQLHVVFISALSFIFQAVVGSRAEGDSMVTGLRSGCDGLQLQDSVAAELQTLVQDAEQQWRTLLQTAAQEQLRTLSNDFEAQSENTQAWIREKQQQLQTVGAQTPPEERSLAAQVWGGRLPTPTHGKQPPNTEILIGFWIFSADHPELQT